MLRPVNLTCECYLQLEEMLNRRTGCLEEIEGFPGLKSLVWDWFEMMMGLGGCGQCSVWAGWELEVLVLQKGWWGTVLTELIKGKDSGLAANSPCPRALPAAEGQPMSQGHNHPSKWSTGERGMIQITSSRYLSVHRWPQNLVLPLLSSYRPVLNIFFLSLFSVVGSWKHSTAWIPQFLWDHARNANALETLVSISFFGTISINILLSQSNWCCFTALYQGSFIVGSCSNCSLRAGTPQCRRLSWGAPSSRAGFGWCQLLHV